MPKLIQSAMKKTRARGNLIPKSPYEPKGSKNKTRSIIGVK